MKKNFNVRPYLFPMPTYMIGTYNNDGSVDEMMMAWGGICNSDMVELNLEESHKTVQNIKDRKAFTVGIPSVKNIKECDYLGTVSGNTDKDKFLKTKLHATKSQFVDAPVVEEFLITAECSLVEIKKEVYGLRILGKIENILVDESVIKEDGKIDTQKVDAFVFDQMNNSYFSIGKDLGKAWNLGKIYMK